MIHAMKRIKESGEKPPCTIQFAGAVDEEYLFRGALDLAANLKAEAVVVAEPTDLSVIRAHKGVARFRIHIEGIAAHSSKPYLGVNAIVKMAQLITDIEREVLPTFQEKDHPLTGGPTLNIGVISGGAQVNFVPDSCTIEIDRRVIPGEIAEQTLSIFEKILSHAKTKDPDLKVKLEDPFLLDGAMETPEDSRIVQVASDASQTVIGNSTITGVPYGTDASKFTAVGIPAIVLGPGSIDQAHGAVEWVECSQVLQAVDIYQAIMMNFH
jgi:acetylornithine deacetylase